MGTIPHFIDGVTGMRDSTVCLPAQRQEDQESHPALHLLSCCPKIRAEKSTEKPLDNTHNAQLSVTLLEGLSGRKQGGRARRGKEQCGWTFPRDEALLSDHNSAHAHFCTSKMQ